MSGADSCAAAPVTPNGCASSSVSSISKDGPVLILMNKRLRALKKKYNRILQIEESKMQGKKINQEQEEVLKTKPSITILIDEYEKLRQPLAVAVKEEVAEREKELLSELKESKAEDTVESNEEENNEEENNEEENNEEQNEITAVKDADSSLPEEKIEDLLNLVYFGLLFDLRNSDMASLMWTRYHERMSCLSYDFVTDDDSAKPLREEDLTFLSFLTTMVTSRPPNSTLSHQQAIKDCVQHAKEWLLNSDNKIHPDHPITYSSLKERLRKILSSDYYTMSPEMRPVVQPVTQPEVAAVTAGQYATQILIHNNTPVEGQSFHMEVPAVYCPVQGQAPNDHKAYENLQHIVNPVVTEQQDSVRESNPKQQYALENESSFQMQNELIQNQHGSAGHIVDEESSPEQYNLHTQFEEQYQMADNQEQHQVDGEVSHPAEQDQSDNQQHDHSQNGGMSRSYQNHRGGRGGYYGGRGRGYSNAKSGRGRGSGYSNGRSYYHDQNNYQPRYFSNGRGRGRRSNDSFYHNNGGGQAQRSEVAAQI